MREEYKPTPGPCLGEDRLFDIMHPRVAVGYWAGDVINCLESYTSGFNPLRQNIILFMAAMNGEL